MNALNKNSRIPITSCKNLLPILAELITELPKILEQSPILEQKLYAINLLANTKNECIITLIYHKTLDSVWEENARELFNTLGLSKNSGIIGISKRQEILINTKTLTQSTTLNYPFAKNHNLKLEQIKSKIYKNENGYTLSEVNSLHSNFFNFISKFRGASTKHLQRYID